MSIDSTFEANIRQPDIVDAFVSTPVRQGARETLGSVKTSPGIKGRSSETGVIAVSAAWTEVGAPTFARFPSQSNTAVRRM